MICALSGKETSDAVVSPKSGGIFDRKLAETYVSTAGKDPLNDEPLNVEELVRISSGGLPIATQPAPAAFNSIPTMLAAFQNEWDAMALEVFALRKQLHSTRQELSTALYKCEAAIRVAARMTREKEEAQQALHQIAETFASGTKSQEQNDVTMEPETTANLEETAKQDSVAIAKDTDDFSRRKTEKKFDAVAFLHEAGSAKPVGVDVGGAHVLFSDETFPLSIETVRQVIAHPSEPYFVIVTNDQRWVLAGKAGIIHTSEPVESILAADIHVDGALLGLASAHKVDIVDLTSFNTVSSISLTDFTQVSKISFALNGYWLLVGGKMENGLGAVRIYDLRKSVLVHSFEASADAEFAIDASCQALVVCDKTQQKLMVHLYAKKGKKWTENVHVEECGALHALHMESSAEEIQSSKTVKVMGLLEDEIVHYAISLE
ncbi:hypothetical protein JCM33374_g3814 [Metschnikowia sp. JCM 33374]|nr:hypothetical protein JCM33374_g3814 [Metschnikowia sp. JCM 33374]